MNGDREKWEYYKILSYSIHEGDLNTLGDKGWELVGFDMQGNAYFKRRIVEKET